MRIEALRTAAFVLMAGLCLATPCVAAATPALLAQAQTPASAQAPDAATVPSQPVAPPPTASAPASTHPIAPAPAPMVVVPVPAPEAEGANLSPWAMFLHADLVVKGVMVGLAFASVVVWTICLGKGAALVAATLLARRAARALREADGLESGSAAPWAGSRPILAMVEIARGEVRRSAALPAEGVKERAALAVQRVEARAARDMARGTGLIATIGSTAPFVGLFGTVWGIMDSFVGITKAHTSNLAVVAPGIAEALLATAIGLVAAIPAVVIFNGFARATAGYRALLGDASADVMRHLSRDLDRRNVAAAQPNYRAAE